MRRILETLLLVFLSTASVRDAAAQDWAKAMFDHTSHDFGMVARGANVEHRFSVENIYLEDAHIKSVSSSCSCTSVRVTEPSLKTYEKSEVVATLNTRQFTGRKDATIRVVFDKPFPAEVQLHCYSYIRTDVVLEPGEVTFGQVPEGAEVEKQITLSHAGPPSWRITGVNSDPNLAVTVEPLTQTGTQSTYLLKFLLKATTPPGYIRSHVTLRTNDAKEEAQQVVVAVEGVVMPAVTIRPSPLGFGPVRVNTSMTRNVVIQGQKPFQIKEIAGPDKRFTFGTAAQGTSATLHLVPVTFSAGAQTGKVSGQILIRTDIGGGRILTLEVTGDVFGPTGVTSPASVSPPGEASATPGEVPAPPDAVSTPPDASPSPPGGASTAPGDAPAAPAAPAAAPDGGEPAATKGGEGWKNANHSS